MAARRSSRRGDVRTATALHWPLQSLQRKSFPSKESEMMLVCRVLTLGLVLSLAAPALAITEQATQTATEFYQAYRKAFAKAQKVEDIMPMMAASQRAKMEKTPADERKMMFGM